jgi:hypothetical protein
VVKKKNKFFQSYFDGLSYLQRAVLNGAGSDKCHNHGHHVNRQLKLEEFSDAIVHVTAPHDRLHNAAEVVVGEDDVGRFFRYISASDTLEC